MRRALRRPRATLLVAMLLVAPLLVACGSTPEAEPEKVDTSAPEVGACRMLDAEDLTRATNDDEPVPCAEQHTAETYAVGSFGKAFADAEPDDRELGAKVYDTCQPRFMRHVGGTDSLVMRSVLTWAWFRPSDEAWEAGARWFRCDVVGGGEQSEALVGLPESSEGLLLGIPDDRWMICADGPAVTGSVKLPCSEPHTWRAVTTIVLGKAGDPYPGDRVVEVRSRDFCSDSVGAWLNYPIDYDYGYTWFHEPEWQAGNRRSVCWAKTTQ